MLSAFHIWGKGRIVENLPFGDTEIRFTPIEHQPMNPGEETERVDTLAYTGEEASGKAYATKANTSGSLRAKWLPFGSNRMTAPNVCRGEVVTIWATGDHGEFRWTADGDHDNLRNTEVVVFGFAAAKDFSSQPDKKSSMYIFEVNTEKGHIVLHTSTARGEVCTYTVSIDAMNGLFTIEDGMQNMIQSNALEAMIKLSNRYGSEVGIHQDRVWLSGERVTLDAKNVDCTGTLNVKGEVKAAAFRQPAGTIKKPFN
jgi:hypothetical protein